MRTFPSPAKINLMLRIVRQEQNGYHYLQTIFQFIDLIDYITFEPLTDNRIECHYHNQWITAENDLIIKAINLLKNITGIEKGLQISLKKNIPTGAGLGGGSSNAATTLIALNQLWHLKFSSHELQKIGRTLGADVPIFIHGQSAWAEGIGDEFSPIHLPEKDYLLLIPPFGISTQTIFKSPLLERTHDLLNKNAPFNYLNDCTSAIFHHYPLMETYITQLTHLGYSPKITGTGSCMYLDLPNTPKDLELLEEYCHKVNVKTHIFKTLKQSPLLSL